MLEAIQEGFLQTHRAMKRVVDKWPKTASGFTSTSGTTASVAFVRNGKLYSGHVGDSGIVLGIRESTDENIVGKQLTIDHKPDSPGELRRIENSGGQVMCKAGVMRVVWTRPVRGHVGPVRRSTPQEKIPFLAVARALGDLWSYNDQSDKYVVSPDPDMDVVKLSCKQKCMVLGSDGLWNVIKSQYCVDIVNAHEWKELKEEGRLDDNLKFLNRPCHSNHSRWLIRHALRGWGTLRADNISVITVIFDPPDAKLEDKSSCVVEADPNLDVEKVLTDTPDAMIRITPYTTQEVATVTEAAAPVSVTVSPLSGENTQQQKQRPISMSARVSGTKAKKVYGLRKGSAKRKSAPSRIVATRKTRTARRATSTPFVHNTRQYSRVTRAGTHLSPTRSLPSIKDNPKLRSAETRQAPTLETEKGRTVISKRKLFQTESAGKQNDNSLSEQGPIPKRGRFWNSLLTVFGAPSTKK